MDVHHRFHTDATFRWVRAEHLALCAALVALCAAHAGEVRWGRFAASFLAIDVIGYLPGAIAARRAGAAGRAAPLHHHLYNVTHSYLTAGLVAGLWALVAGPEWAMLAAPIHLAGDRGLFGNTYKPVELPFEPDLAAVVDPPADRPAGVPAASRTASRTA
jgi:hypothetical protein